MKKEDVLELKNRRSRVFSIVLALMLCISGIAMPEFSVAETPSGPADKTDKTELIKDSIKSTITQGGKELTDTIDPKAPFRIAIKFSFPIIKDELLGTPAADGITNKAQQVDEGDFAIFPLGKNFKADKSTPKKIPVRINSPDNPKDHGKCVGTITLEEIDGTLNAKMHFKGPENIFKYESDHKRVLTVKFYGMFRLCDDSTSNPGENDPNVTILNKNYKVPEVEEVINYAFKKSGKFVDHKKKDFIDWECTVEKTSNKKNDVHLGGEIFNDDLSKVGEYVEGSFKVNGNGVDDISIYNKDTKFITYKFPDNFDKGKAKITFRTKVPNNANTVSNKAILSLPDGNEKTAENTLEVHPLPKVSKNLESVSAKEDGEREMIWTILAGTPYESYGPAWIGDILSGTLKNQQPPTRAELTYEYSLNGEEGTWETVSDNNIITVENPGNFPKFPKKGTTECPDLTEYVEGKIYNLGANWHGSTRSVEGQDEYTPLENHWIFIKNLEGMYRITVRLYYKDDIEVGQLKNDAEIHTCSKTVYPKTPPIYSGIGLISKHAKTDDNDNSINQGILPWSVSVNFEKVFPADDRFVYECFYYGDEEKFKEEKATIHTNNEALISKEVLKYMIDGKDNATYFNFNQAYIENSVTPEKGKENSEPLHTDTIKLYNNDDKEVGEIVKISGFKDIKTYNFDLKTRAQNIIENLKKNYKTNPSGTNYTTYKNTAVLAVGSGETFKTLSAYDKHRLPVGLLSKFAIEFDTMFENLDDYNLSNTPYVNDNNTFNYNNRTVLFRIDVNPQGMSLNEYVKALSGKSLEGDFTNIEIKDTLEEGLSLDQIDGNDFLIYEAAPSKPGNISKAIKKIAPTDANVEFNKQDNSWKFSNYNGTPYIIIIRAKVSDKKFEQLIKKTPQGESIKFKNEVSLKADNEILAETSCYAYARPHMLNKETPTITGDTLNWMFEYKPFNIRLNNVVFQDILDENIGLPLDKKGNISLAEFKIQRSNDLQHDGSYKNFTDVKVVTGKPNYDEVSVRYDMSKHIIFFTIPNTPKSTAPYSYKFEYQTIMRPTNLEAKVINNKVIMTSDNKLLETEGNSSISAQQYAAFASINDSPYFVIQKADSNGKPLGGAVFEYKNKEGDLVKCTTDNNGRIFIVKMSEGINEIEEIKAPDGYIRLTKPIKVDVQKNGVKVISPNEIQGKGTFDNPFIINNNKLRNIDIPVTKKWVNDKASERPESITVNLLKDGKPMDKMTLKLDAENGWKGKFENLPYTDGDGNVINYTISENKVPGYSSKITGSPTKGFVITNSKPGSNAKTGDNNLLYLWGILALISALGLIGIKYGKNKYRKN